MLPSFMTSSNIGKVTCNHLGDHLCRFLERMTAALTRKAGQEAKLLAAAKEVEGRRNEAKLQLMALAPKVNLPTLVHEYIYFYLYPKLILESSRSYVVV